MTTPGRREIHKSETRASLLAAARARFTEQGYDATTVREIAAAAGVTERTFFRYFASKEDLVYSEVRDLVPVLRAAIVSAPPNMPALAAVRDAALKLGSGGSVPSVLFSGPPMLRPIRPTTPVRGLVFALESGLADAIEERIAPSGGTRFHAEVLARTSVGVLRSCLIAFHLAGGPGKAPAGMLRDLIIDGFGVVMAQGPFQAGSAPAGRPGA